MGSFHKIRVLKRDGHRFFRKDMHSCLQGADCHGGMQVMGQAKVDHINSFFLQILEAGSVSGAEGGGKGPSLFNICVYGTDEFCDIR